MTSLDDEVAVSTLERDAISFFNTIRDILTYTRYSSYTGAKDALLSELGAKLGTGLNDSTQDRQRIEYI